MKKSTGNKVSTDATLDKTVLNKACASVQALPLLSAHPQAVMPVLQLVEQAHGAIEEVLGAVSQRFIEELLMLSARSVAGDKHPGRVGGDVRWHGSQAGVVALGRAKVRVQRPRLRSSAGEVAVPAYEALARDVQLSQRMADVLMCNVSTRKYERVVHRCAQEVGISKSAVSRQFVKSSAAALKALMSRDFSQVRMVAIYMDGIIIAQHHMIAAVGVDATGKKHLLGLVSGSSENARVAKDLLHSLSDRGVELSQPRLWVIDGSKALRSALQQCCGQAAKVQRCRIHKIRNVTERLPQQQARHARWVMEQAFKLQPAKGKAKLKGLAKHLSAQHPDAATSVLEGLDEMFTINDLGVSGELARCLGTTNIIESPNSVVRRTSARVTHYKDADMTLRWCAAGFLEAEKSFRRVRGYQQLKDLIKTLDAATAQRDSMSKAA
jgi:putative transposase